MQSDKDKDQQPGQPPQQDAGSGMSPPPPPPKQKKSIFGTKGPKKHKMSKSKPAKPARPPREKKVKQPKPPREKKVKAPRQPKGPRKPLFSFGKKQKQPPLTYASPGGPPAAESGPGAGAPPVPSETAQTAKSEKKSLFGGKKEHGSKPPRVKKEKKPKAQRAKKPKAPKGQKKPLFSFGKKSAAPVATSVPPERMSPAGESGEPEGDAASGPKGMFGKKGPKQPRVKEAKSRGARKTKSAGGGFGSSKTSPVGLDLGRSSITAVRLRYQTGGSTLLQAANDTLPEGLIQEGEVRDVEALSFAIKEFWKTHKIKGKKVSLGLANQKVVVRTLEFPMLDPKELRSAIEFQAQDYIPIPIEDAVFDFHILGRFADEEGIEKQKVLVVAAQKVMVMDFINAIKGAKLSIAGVDLQAFALLRALAPVSFLDQGPSDRATAIANIGSDVTNLVVDLGGEPQFTRIIAFGGDNFTKALQDMQGISFIEAEKLKAETGLSEPSTRTEPESSQHLPESGMPGAGDIPGPGIEPGFAPEPEPGFEPAAGQVPANEPEYLPGPEFPAPPEAETGKIPSAEPSGQGEEGSWPATPPVEAESEQEMHANVQRTLESVADSLADEIRRSLDYYMSQEQSAPIGRLLISGGGAMLKHLDAHLSQLFPFAVQTGNPMLRVGDNKSDMSDEQIQALSPQLTIALGLALEDEG